MKMQILINIFHVLGCFFLISSILGLIINFICNLNQNPLLIDTKNCLTGIVLGIVIEIVGFFIVCFINERD